MKALNHTKETEVLTSGTVKLFSNSLVKLYLDEIDRSEITLTAYRNHLNNFMNWIDTHGVKQPEKADIKLYKQELAENYSTATQADYLRSVKSFFSWCEKNGYYRNVAADIHGVTVRQDKHNKDSLTDEAVMDIYNTIASDNSEQGLRLKAMYLLCITGGLRCIELHRANRGDLETVGDKTFLRIQGKGHTEKDSKILIADIVQEALQDYFNAQTIKTDAKSPLFTATGNRNKGGRIAVTTISTMLKEAMQQAGYNSPRLTAHSLRHTSGTAAYKISKNIFEAQKHCRHTKTETTGIYVHALEREERTTEQAICDHFFNNKEADLRTKVLSRIENLTPEQLEKVASFLDMI